MAGFQEVMQQWRRVCDMYTTDEANTCCKGCPMENKECGAIYETGNADFDAIEYTIMEWVAEHPEPVYPTWGEWLAEQGELGKNWGDIRVISSAGNGVGGVIGWFYKNIPADIAEKLGIEPKEVM